VSTDRSAELLLRRAIQLEARLGRVTISATDTWRGRRTSKWPWSLIGVNNRALVELPGRRERGPIWTLPSLTTTESG